MLSPSRLFSVIPVLISGSQSGSFLRKKAQRRSCWWRRPEGGGPECPALSDCAPPFTCVWARACMHAFGFPYSFKPANKNKGGVCVRVHSVNVCIT